MYRLPFLRGVIFAMEMTGRFNLISVGGAPPYTYTITGDNAPAPFDVMSNDTTINIAGLGVGVHKYTLLRCGGCLYKQSPGGIGTSDGLEVFGFLISPGPPTMPQPSVMMVYRY